MKRKKINAHTLREMRPCVVGAALMSYQRSKGIERDDMLELTGSDIEHVNEDMHNLGSWMVGYMISTGDRGMKNVRDVKDAGRELTAVYSFMGEENFLMIAKEAARAHYAGLARLLDAIMK